MYTLYFPLLILLLFIDYTSDAQRVDYFDRIELNHVYTVNGQIRQYSQYLWKNLGKTEAWRNINDMDSVHVYYSHRRKLWVMIFIDTKRERVGLLSKIYRKTYAGDYIITSSNFDNGKNFNSKHSIGLR